MLSQFQYLQFLDVGCARKGIGEFPVVGHRVNDERRGVDDSPSGVEVRGKRGSGHDMRKYGNNAIVLSRCVEERALILYLKRLPFAYTCSGAGQQQH